jgi:predicted ATPase/transcriptional regulator with XRE-family HTH domain
MEATSTFGQWVKQRRKALGLTQAELGRLVSCSKIMIIKIEGNQRRPSIQIAKLLLRYLKIAPKERSAFMSLARPELSLEQIDEAVLYSAQLLYRSTNRRITNLPTPPTPLIGQADEVSTICSLLLDSDIRLVTLTGTGGVGKTRLSLQVATELNEQFADGCWFISLAALEDSDLVIPTIARGLGIKESRERTLDEALLNWLADKDLLLVLDNFEQIIPAARKVAEILTAAAGLKVLITSRTVLHLYGEYEFLVPPLRFVDPSKALSEEELVNSPAVALFVQRARAVNLTFKLTSENSIAVAKICARLGGLSLAIELAASRIKFLTPAALLARLEGTSPEDSSLNLLVGGGQDLPTRQQTMRRTIDWSYNLLSKNEQILFLHLAVFVGGCSLEAAAAVCGDITKESVPITTSALSLNTFEDRLSSLVDQSMLRQTNTAGGEQRFEMLESLREYALERLSMQRKEWAVLKCRHAKYFLALAEAAEPRLEGNEQEIWLERLEMEHDNLSAALTWSYTSQDEGEIGLLLAGAVWQFWLIHGYINEGMEWFSRLIERAKSAPKLARARAFNGFGFLNWAWNDFHKAKILLNESLSIFRELEDKYGIAWVLNHLAHVALAQNELEFAAESVQESLALFKELGADSNIAWNLLNLGDIVRAQGNETQANIYYAESLELFRKVGDHRGMAWALDHLGSFTESINLFRKLGDKAGTAWALNHQGGLMLAQGDFQQAQLLVAESLNLFREIGSLRKGAWITLDMGDGAWAVGNETWAKSLFKECLKLFHEVDDQRGIAQVLERLERLGHAADLD